MGNTTCTNCKEKKTKSRLRLRTQLNDGIIFNYEEFMAGSRYRVKKAEPDNDFVPWGNYAPTYNVWSSTFTTVDVNGNYVPPPQNKTKII